MRRYLAFLVIFLIPSFSYAQVIITEVMYDLAEGSDSGREWIEVVNTGSIPIVLTDWRIVENGTNHKVTALGEKTLSPGAYAVVADNPQKFKSDWPSFDGQVFDSAFSLSNDGESVALSDGTRESDSVSFSSALGGKGSGDSLQRPPTPGSSFAAGMPTPGMPIPAGGLVMAPPKTKTGKAVQNTAAVSGAPSMVGTTTSSQESAFLAASSPADPAVWPWLMSVLVLASATSAGILISHHAKKTEWEIEEMPESS